MLQGSQLFASTMRIIFLRICEVFLIFLQALRCEAMCESEKWTHSTFFESSVSTAWQEGEAGLFRAEGAAIINK